VIHESQSQPIVGSDKRWMRESLRQVRAGAGHNEVPVGRWSSSMRKWLGAPTIACYAPSIPPRKLQGLNRLMNAS